MTESQRSGFEGILPKQSAAIYRELTAGKVILRSLWNVHTAELEDNPLYNLVFNHLSHFTELYAHLGYELAFSDAGGFFYLREVLDDDSDEHDENALKIQVALLLIGRYFARTGRDLMYLGRADAGLKDEDLNAMAADDEYNDILRTARFDKGWGEAMDFLVRRHFVFRSGPERFFLSSAGMNFLIRLVSAFSEDS
ncbi:condensin complex protein MksE [Allohahella marinimesophila]